MYADDNGLSTHSPAHASIFLHPSVIRPFALTSDRRGEQTIEGEDEVSLNQVLLEKKTATAEEATWKLQKIHWFTLCFSFFENLSIKGN